MTPPDKTAFQNLLSDYMAETVDDGFSDHLLQTLEKRSERERRLRRVMLLGAYGLGGYVTSRQLQKLFATWDGFNIDFNISSWMTSALQNQPFDWGALAVYPSLTSTSVLLSVTSIVMVFMYLMIQEVTA